MEFNRTGSTTYLPKHTHTIKPLVITNQTLRIPKACIDKRLHFDISCQLNNNSTITFADHIAALPLWEQELIKHYSLHLHTDIVIEHLHHNFIIATDGSEQDNKGSFGWVLSTATGTMLATGQGTAFGHRISSFRCESYGILAALHFIINLRRFYHTPTTPNTVQWWCDCQSLLSRLNPSSIDNPNNSKLAEHDLEHSIRQAMPNVSPNITYHHLKSHQYDNTPLHSIPIPYQLNRIADKLANQHNTTLSHPMEKVPLLNPAQCQLQIKGKTITRSIARHLQQAFSIEASTKHLMNRLGLHSNYRYNIAWPEFSRAFRSFPSTQQRILGRWIYGFLPTQRRLHRAGVCPSPLCPTCRQHTETDVHFLTCGGAISWKEYLLDPLDKLFTQQKAGQWIESGLRNNIKNFMNQQAPSTTHPWIQPAVDSQTELGWQSLFSGILSNSWVSYQNQCHPSKNGSSLICKMIKLIFKSIIQRWSNRNTILHNNQQHSEIRARLSTRVRALYQMKDQMLITDQPIFDVPIDQMLTQPIKTLELFVEQYSSIVQKSVRQQHLQLQRQHRDITTYFHPVQKDKTRVTQDN